MEVWIASNLVLNILTRRSDEKIGNIYKRDSTQASSLKNATWILEYDLQFKFSVHFIKYHLQMSNLSFNLSSCGINL